MPQRPETAGHSPAVHIPKQRGASVGTFWSHPLLTGAMVTQLPAVSPLDRGRAPAGHFLISRQLQAAVLAV
jgi:hypothetical protein